MYTWEMLIGQLKFLIKLHHSNSFLNILDSTQEDLCNNTQDLKETLNNGTSNVETELGPMIQLLIVKMKMKNIVKFSHHKLIALSSIQSVTMKEQKYSSVMINHSQILTSKSNQSYQKKIKLSIFTTCLVGTDKLPLLVRALLA